MPRSLQSMVVCDRFLLFRYLYPLCSTWGSTCLHPKLGFPNPLSRFSKGLGIRACSGLESGGAKFPNYLSEAHSKIHLCGGNEILQRDEASAV